MLYFYFFVYFAFQGPIVAGLANKFGCRAVVMGGGLVTAIMYFLTVLAPKVWIMLITYGVIGGIKINQIKSNYFFMFLN